MNARSRPVRAFEAMLSLVVLGLLVLLADARHANAHDARPAYLALTETAPDRFDVVWRTPVVSGMRLPVVLQLPEGATNVTKPSVHELPDSVVERRVIAVPGGLGGKRMEFVGLQGTITDVLVRVETRDGAHSTTLVHPSQPWIAIPTARGTIAVAGAYVRHGVEHILLGYDHLLFVFALILIVRNVRKLVTTVTAFTLAHSITLGLSALGVVHVPGPPVEASIALSILLLACETTRQQRGERSLTAEWPWLVAFAFGLLHGFGFASALADIGFAPGRCSTRALRLQCGHRGRAAWVHRGRVDAPWVGAASPDSRPLERADAPGCDLRHRNDGRLLVRRTTLLVLAWSLRGMAEVISSAVTAPVGRVTRRTRPAPFRGCTSS